MSRSNKSAPRRQPADKVRCAIYTRKSSEEGLEQDFNSLDAQREACEAYILSQKHEGWIPLSQMYDDGGLSGGTLERPALRRLLADIEAGRIDTVVVYKVDRLTRSLGDFAKIVDVFDNRGVSFVSVTQQFNTTSSMGRLTLNMLLSFAQFEREVTGERIRDKIAASKKKGMWMGGLPPLGYDVQDRKLVVNAAEAETVRHIYRRYADLASVRRLKEDIDRSGIVSKTRTDKYGRITGGKPFARGALYLMLQNRLYRGEIVHKDKSYPGQHDAIVDKDLWDIVQRRLAENRVETRNGARAASPSLLAGLLYDDTGARMTPSHANKKGVRYRYYISYRLMTGRREANPQARRVPAGDVETLVEDRLRRFLESDTSVAGTLEPDTDANAIQDLVKRSDALAARWPTLAPAERRALIRQLVARVDLNRETIDIHLMPARLPAILREEGPLHDFDPLDEAGPQTLLLSIPARLKRVGRETRYLIEGVSACTQRNPDHSLHRLLGQAHRFQKMVLQNPGRKISEMAVEAGVGGSYFTRILRLSFLAPDIVTTILHDNHPLELSAKSLSRDTRLPLAWQDQRARLGFA